MAALVQQSAACVSKFSSTAFHSWNSACSSRDVSLASGVGCPPGTFLLLCSKFPCYSTKSFTYDDKEDENGKAFRSGRRRGHLMVSGGEPADKVMPSTFTQSPGGNVSRRQQKFVATADSGRRVMYGDAETYILLEPGEDEQFLTSEELQERLKTWLQEWPGRALPVDLAKFKTVEDAVAYLMDSACELDLGDGQGSLQWFEVVYELTVESLQKSVDTSALLFLCNSC